MIPSTTIRYRITTTEEMLGSACNNPDVHAEFIASKAPDAVSTEEEIAAIGADEVIDKGRTVFPRDDAGNPVMWDYQIKGMFKDAAGMLKRVPGTLSSKIKAYKKEIDGAIFVHPRQIPIKFDGEIGRCQRPLRAQTMQGERVALADSESIPAGAVIEIDVEYLNAEMHQPAVEEWLSYGKLRGLGQWRNSGKGKFVFERLGTVRNGELIPD